MAIPLPAKASSDGQTEGKLANAKTSLTYVASKRNGAIDLILTRDGPDLVLRDGGIVVCHVPAALVSAVEIGGPDRANTTLTIDYAAGPIRVPIDYHPGALGPQTDNLLNLRGAGNSAIVHATAGPHDGTITVDGAPIRYSNLTPITDTSPAVNLTFNAFLSVAPASFKVVDGPVVGGFQTTEIISSSSPPDFEMTSLANKTNVTINVELLGATVRVNNPLVGAGMTHLALNGNQGAIANGASTFIITPNPSVLISVNGNLDNGTPTDALSIDVAGATDVHITADYGPSGISGSYTFGNRQTVSFSQMASISPTPDLAAKIIPTLSLRGLIMLSVLTLLTAAVVVRCRRSRDTR